MPEPRIPVTGRLIFGLVVVAIGVLFTLDNLGVLAAGEILRWWPALLLAYGLGRLTGFCCRRHFASGILFTLLGAWLLLFNFDFISLDAWDLWPLILVAIGFTMVTGALRRARGTVPLSGAGAGEDPASTLSAFALWSGVERKVMAQDFRGGDITAIMGGHEIDLRPARMAGGSATLDLLVVMGGVDLRVPEDWRVTCDAFALMGGVEDTTRAPAGEARGHLILKGLVLMGGVEVKN